MLFNRCCPDCGEPSKLICDKCVANFLRGRVCRDVDGVEAHIGLVSYTDRVSRCVLAAKSGRRPIARQLGSVMAKSLSESAKQWQVESVCWVPASVGGKRERGYDQGKLLAKSIAAQIEVPALPLLKRLDTVRQTGANRSARAAGPKLVCKQKVTGSVIIVDDVLTTGASLRAAAQALQSAGASGLYAGTVAVVL